MIKVLGTPIKMQKTPGGPKTPAPVLGQHTEDVLCGLVGITRQEMEHLKAEGVI